MSDIDDEPVYVEDVEVSDEVSAVLERYIEESTDEYVDDDADLFESVNETIDNIRAAYESGELSESEFEILTENTLGAGGAREKFIKTRISSIKVFCKKWCVAVSKLININKLNASKGKRPLPYDDASMVAAKLMTAKDFAQVDADVKGIQKYADISLSSYDIKKDKAVDMLRDGANVSEAYKSMVDSIEKEIAKLTSIRNFDAKNGHNSRFNKEEFSNKYHDNDSKKDAAEPKAKKSMGDYVNLAREKLNENFGGTKRDRAQTKIYNAQRHANKY